MTRNNWMPYGYERQTPQVQVTDVDKTFTSPNSDVDVFALKGINLDIYNGEFVCILGPSGCGKTTLLNAIAGFTLPTSGKIVANGKEVTAPGPDRGMIFQEYAIFPWMTVAENVAFGLENRNEPKTVIKKKVDDLLKMLMLSDFRNRYPKDLSGGMRQRVAIARILALDSPMMLMDEPFGALDSLTRRSLQDELLRIWKEFNKTIIFVTHSIEESIYLADRVVIMTYRPGTIKKTFEIAVPRPRNISSKEFISYQQEMTQLVMEEQLRHNEE